MSINILDFIEKKKLGGEHEVGEISEFVKSIVAGKIPDYQVAAWLMAVRLKGMGLNEIVALTKAMAESGMILDLSEFENSVDKHSTGGVGDKATLVVAPLVASVGIPVIKFSGRALDFTGGTLDKLESIPGFKTNLSSKEIFKQAREIGLVIAGASDEMAPADKVLYALRDVTSTVDSIPLIASSIMSKKIAGGAKNIVLDVKFGNGAFMREFNDARELAEIMVSIAKNLGRNARAVLSSMESPLGNYVGNALEIIEVIETLKGNGPSDLLELSLVLASAMVSLSRGVKNTSEIREEIHEHINNGKALEKFSDFVKEQGGDKRIIDDYGLLPHASFRYSVNSESDGFVHKISAREIGNLVRNLGGGRTNKDDKINPSVGVKLHKKPGDSIAKGDRLLDVYYDEEDKKEIIEAVLTKAVSIERTIPEPVQFIREII